ncbi:unnamed protein product [Phytomonas sp. Hart1]|nr:unnamed protein product [Phytomonas sp. Hart1]|eukprot:CCW66618.1 unnamed protein product [Phytomonas sp. isolate Hart1]
MFRCRMSSLILLRPLSTYYGIHHPRVFPLTPLLAIGFRYSSSLGSPTPSTSGKGREGNQDLNGSNPPRTSGSNSIDGEPPRKGSDNSAPQGLQDEGKAKGSSPSAGGSSGVSGQGDSCPDLKITLSGDNVSIPKGFESFYGKPLLMKMPPRHKRSDSITRAYGVLPEERIIIMEIETRMRVLRTLRNFLIFSGALIAITLYRWYMEDSNQRADITDYKTVVVNVQRHTATFLNDRGRIVGVRHFIDFSEFEKTCNPDSDILLEFSSYFPWVPMLLLCLMPLLAVVNAKFNGSAKMATMMAQIEKKRFNFKRETLVNTRLSDVAGLTEAKHEVLEVVDFLKNPKQYQQLGARLPKGVLLDGPPGVGKTLLAKAVAGEAMVPFVSCSGSEFDEVYVGVGAQRVRELFREANKCKPCVVFIDEIDSFGRKRRSDSGGNSRGTLNAFLSELDGFKDSSGIIVLAATNRADILDNALTRSGRFDRKVSLEKPSHKDRVAIAMVHLQPLRLEPSTKPQDYAEIIAALTPGCSGADIFNICNEAAIHAAREAQEYVATKHFHAAVERVLMGLEKSAVRYTPSEKERIAYHEAGVVVLNWFQKETDPVIKTTILPRGQHRTGVTQMLPKRAYISTEEQLLQRIVGILGGYVAEEYFFHDVSTSAANDLQNATKLALEMVCTYGMDPKNIGHFGYELNRDDAIQKPFGEEKENAVDASVERIVQECLCRARALLQEYHHHVRIIGGLLIQQETLNAHKLWFALGDRPTMSEEFQVYLES